MPNNVFALDCVSQTFVDASGKHVVALKNVSLKVEPGAFLSIVGPSGCGKSTLLRIIAGLAVPTSGKVERGVKTLAMVFQNFALFPWLTVEENVEFGLKMRGMPAHERKKIARDKLLEVGLTEHAARFPRELSGGQRQRVGIARALAVSPDALLLDEPFSSLDPFTAETLKKDLLQIWQKYKMTVVMVTHTVEDAIELATDIVVMSARPGTILEDIHVHTPYPRDMRSDHTYSLADKIRGKIRGAETYAA